MIVVGLLEAAATDSVGVDEAREKAEERAEEEVEAAVDARITIRDRTSMDEQMVAPFKSPLQLSNLKRNQRSSHKPQRPPLLMR